MLDLGYRKFIKINAKDQKLPWMSIIHYIIKVKNGSFCFTSTPIK